MGRTREKAVVANLRRWAREKAVKENKPKGWKQKLVNLGRGKSIDLKRHRQIRKDRARRAEREARIRAKIQHRTELQGSNRGLYGQWTKCVSCGKRMKKHAWRTQCKNCDPVRTVD